MLPAIEEAVNLTLTDKLNSWYKFIEEIEDGYRIEYKEKEEEQYLEGYREEEEGIEGYKGEENTKGEEYRDEGEEKYEVDKEEIEKVEEREVVEE